MTDERDPERSRLTPDEAEARLGDHPLVAALEGSLPEMKVLRDQCLAAGIPALVGCPGGGAVTS
jgi:hypothetical protein